MKILLVGIDFFDYTNSLQRGFERLGHTVQTIIIKQGWGTAGKIHNELYNIFQSKITHTNNIYRFPKLLREKRSKEVVKIAKGFKPDMLVAFPGYGLTGNALKAIGKVHKSAWIYDSIKRLPDMQAVLHLYDDVFSFEGSDLGEYKELGCNAEFLPLCVDDTVYYPVDAEQDIDILFIGNLSETRVRTLLDIREAFPTQKMLVYGRYSKTLEGIPDLNTRLSQHQDIFTMKLVSADEANALYSRSKVCINLHNGQSQYGANMRLFEICAANRLQIVDSNPYIVDNFQECMVITHDSSEMIKAIDYYLSHERERKALAEAGFNKVKESELFVHRAKRIIDRSFEKTEVKKK